VNLVAADTDDEARRLFTSLQQMFLGLIRGARTELPPPVDTMRGRWSAVEETHAHRMMRCSAVGSSDTVRRELAEIIDQTGADEIIATAQVFDHAARLRSFEIAAGVFEALNMPHAEAAEPCPRRSPDDGFQRTIIQSSFAPSGAGFSNWTVNPFASFLTMARLPIQFCSMNTA